MLKRYRPMLWTLLVLPICFPLAAQTAKRVSFAQDVAPILSENCFSCHGPDEKERKAKFRLDTKEGAFAPLRDGDRAIVPGKPAQSVLLERIMAEEPSHRMPPPKTNKRVPSRNVQQPSGGQ